ncbi:MAG: tyrosine-type recombinase/integrase [Methanotrichaceae archaeon]
MRGTRIKIDWSLTTPSKDNFDRGIDKFRLYLKERGFRDGTIDGYVGNTKRYLKFAQTDHPSADDYTRFRESLHTWKLSRSTLNQYGYAMKAYHKMLGEDVKFTRIEPNNQIPFYFTNEDVDKIFSVIYNLKHLAIFQTLFFGCLRATELCNIDDEDLNLKDLTIRIREGKGGRDGIAYINNTCANTLKEYLRVRPALLIQNTQPLFYTDFGQRWRREDLFHIFSTYKKRAGITKHGGVHVFGRHTPATLMIANGCDIRIVQEVLRHKDIRTTLRYAHVSDKTKREMYEQFLKL